MLISTGAQAAANNGSARAYPFYPSTNSLQSFLRLVNPTLSAASISLGFYDPTTGNQLGQTFAVQNDGFGAPQYAALQLEQCAGISPPAGPSIVAWPLTSANLSVYFEQVLYDPSTGFITSGSSCNTPGVPNTFASDMHTSSIAGYP